MKNTPIPEPFAGANIVGLLLTGGLILLVINIAASLPVAASGFGVAFILGITTNPKYALWFMGAGVLACLMGFAGHDTQIAFGGIGVVLASILVKLFVKS